MVPKPMESELMFDHNTNIPTSGPSTTNAICEGTLSRTVNDPTYCSQKLV